MSLETSRGFGCFIQNFCWKFVAQVVCHHHRLRFNIWFASCTKTLSDHAFSFRSQIGKARDLDNNFVADLRILCTRIAHDDWLGQAASIRNHNPTSTFLFKSPSESSLLALQNFDNSPSRSCIGRSIPILATTIHGDANAVARNCATCIAFRDKEIAFAAWNIWDQISVAFASSVDADSPDGLVFETREPNDVFVADVDQIFGRERVKRHSKIWSLILQDSHLAFEFAGSDGLIAVVSEVIENLMSE